MFSFHHFDLLNSPVFFAPHSPLLLCGCAFSERKKNILNKILYISVVFVFHLENVFHKAMRQEEVFEQYRRSLSEEKFFDGVFVITAKFAKNLFVSL